MSIEISQDTERRLAAEAQRREISVDALLQQFINERAALTHQGQARPGLPVWHLGSSGAYHQRDIYSSDRTSPDGSSSRVLASVLASNR